MKCMSTQTNRIVELKDLEILVAVAGAGSFRAAAAAMQMDPSVISRRIRNLEDRLGASLFERSRSGVRLTDAGRVFERQAGEVIEQLGEATRSLLSAGRAESGKVAFGVLGSLSSDFLRDLIKAFREAHPSVVLTVHEGSTHEHLAAINERSLDLAFVLGAPRLAGFDSEQLWSEAVTVALPSDDTRATQTSMSLASVANDDFIVSYDPPGPEIHDYIVRSISELSFRPSIKRYKVSRGSLLQMVGLSFGISLGCASEMRLSFPNVTFVPLDGAAIPFSAIWSPENDNPALRRFLSLARQLAREERQRDAVSKIPDQWS